MRLIDADALLNDLKASAKSAREWKEETKDEEIKIRADQAHGTFVECALRVKNAPKIEAEPVRHGRWIFVGEETMHDGWTYRKHKCSECGFSTVEAINFCPKCGARMDAEDINVFTKDGMTNGDKIRVMDDEELVEFLMNADANICDFCDMKYPENCLSHSCEGEDCKTEILKWLKQEVSEDAGSKTD